MILGKYPTMTHHYPTILRLSESSTQSLGALTPDALSQFLQAHCRPWMKQFAGERGLLYRCGKVDRGDWTTINVRQDRRPLDSPHALHDLFNEMFTAAGIAANRSNSLFTSGGLSSGASSASSYGSHCFVVVPIGEFDFTWSPEIPDLFSAVRSWSHSDYLLKGWLQWGHYDRWQMSIERLAEYLYTKPEFIETLSTHGKSTYPLSDEVRAVVDSLKQPEVPAYCATLEWIGRIYDVAPALFDYQSSTHQVAAMHIAKDRDPVLRALREDSLQRVISTYTTDDLPAAIESTHEVMIKCDRALLISSTEVHLDPDLERVLRGV